MVKILKRYGPLIDSPKIKDTKDPCPVFDGKTWHIYGSAGRSSSELWNVLHSTSDSLTGPWTKVGKAKLAIKGDHVAAPGVIFDPKEKLFHMFIQTDFMALDTTVEHLISSDGKVFNNLGSIIYSIPQSPEAGVYDPHPALIAGNHYLTYSGTPEIGRPDLYLAKSVGPDWYGPWERVKRILSHEEVTHHNQRDHPDYEWGLEGSQLIELPNGKVLLNAVCFLPEGLRGERQRVFFAIADKPEGPYESLGPVLDPKEDSGWGDGENGHASGFIEGDKLILFYQARTKAGGPWRYGVAEIDINSLN